MRQFGKAGTSYTRRLDVLSDWLRRKCFLEFQGAMQRTELWLNDQRIGEYAVCGYDSFSFDIASALHPGSNVITVLVDNRRHPNIPPDGTKTDYILFDGLYRDVFLHVTEKVHVIFPWELRRATGPVASVNSFLFSTKFYDAETGFATIVTDILPHPPADGSLVIRSCSDFLLGWFF